MIVQKGLSVNIKITKYLNGSLYNKSLYEYKMELKYFETTYSAPDILSFFQHGS